MKYRKLMKMIRFVENILKIIHKEDKKNEEDKKNHSTAVLTLQALAWPMPGFW